MSPSSFLLLTYVFDTCNFFSRQNSIKILPRYVRVSNGKLCFSEKKCSIWKDYMETIINEKNDWDHNVEGDALECPVKSVSRDKMVKNLKEQKTGKVF